MAPRCRSCDASFVVKVENEEADMFRQIIVAVVSAVAAQMTAASLTFSVAERPEPARYEAPQAVVRLAVMPGTIQEIFAAPNVTPFLGASQPAQGSLRAQ
jgi:hypothetical protein